MQLAPLRSAPAERSVPPFNRGSGRKTRPPEARMPSSKSLARAGCRAAFGLLWLSAPLAHAQVSDDVDPFHSAYAPAFGAGHYALGDGSQSRVFRGNFSVKLRESPRDGGVKPGIRLLLPVAVGNQALDDIDLPLDREDRRLEHASFLPGVELELAPGERWTLRTRAQLGASKDYTDSGQSAAIAAAGIRTRYRFEDAPGRPALINGLLWTRFDPNEGDSRSLVRFTTGLELDIPAGGWRVRDQQMSLRPHVLWDGFYRPSAIAPEDDDFEQVESEWQVGLAAGREEGFKILFLRFDAVGIAYRFSDHSAGLRLYLNSAF
jgi:hypothetical protein